jgi:hypothetical protein
MDHRLVAAPHDFDRGSRARIKLFNNIPVADQLLQKHLPVTRDVFRPKAIPNSQYLF